MDDNQSALRVTSWIMIAAVVLPIAVMFFDITYGAVALLGGLLIVYRTFRYRQLLIEGDLDEQSRHGAQRQNQGRTIYVPLLDDAGTPLDPAAAERLLARARLMAGPRETVVGVERTPAEARKL